MKSLLGALLWSLFLLLTLLLHGKEERRRLAEYRALCRLTSHIKASLSASSRPLAAIYADFQDETLGETGFLSLLQRDGLFSALTARRLRLDEEELRPFIDYAKDLGTRLYTEEIQAADALLSSVSLTLKEKESSLPRKEKLTGTLFFSGGMLFLLLLL